MKVHNIVLMLAAFGVGLSAGWALHSLQPGVKPLPNIVTGNNDSVTSYDDSKTAQLRATTQAKSNTIPGVVSDSDQLTANTPLNWSNINDRSDFREHLHALTFIENANEPELMALIESIEANEQNRYQQIWLYRAAVQRWSEINSQAVVHYIQRAQLNDPHAAIENYIEAIAALSTVDSEAAWQLATEFQNQGMAGGYVASEIYAVLAQSDPLATLDRVLASLPNDVAATESIERIVMEWSTSDPAAVLDWIAQNPDLLTQRYIEENALMQLMYQDPQAGLERSSQLSDPQLRMMLETEYASQLAMQSPEQAYQWATNLSNAATRSAARHRVLETWIYKAPDDALAYLASVGSDEIDNSTQHYLYITAATQKGHIDPQNTMNWIESLPHDFQESTRNAFFQNWYAMAPNDAMQWLDYSADYQYKQSMLKIVAPMLPNQNLELALQLYPEQDAQTQSQMGYSIVDQLYRQDPQRAVQWVDGLPADPSNHDARTSLLMLLATEQPLTALKRTTELDGESRLNALAQLGMILTSTHPQLLNSWASTATLTDEERSLLTHPQHTMYPGIAPGYPLDYYELQH